MSDLKEIRAVLVRARRRIRIQVALERATTAAIPAIGCALVVLWAWRMEHLAGGTAVWLAGGLAAVPLVAALTALLHRVTDQVVASRLDRAAGLESRLGTAWDFARGASGRDSLHPDTVALMQAAITDGVRAVGRADVRSAAPFRTPRDTRAAAAFAVVGALVASLAYGPRRGGAALVPAQAVVVPDARRAPDDRPPAIDEEDLAYVETLVEDIREVARQTGDPQMAEFVKRLESLLAKAAKGEISKEQLLAEMDKLEQEHMRGSADLDEALADLEQSGRELKKEPLTRELGEALERNDMEAARRELEKLADAIEKGKLDDRQQKKVADALEKAAEQHEARQKKADENAERELRRKKEQVRLLERKLAEKPQDEKLKRLLDREKRDLERLERKKDPPEREQANKRRLQRLHRNLRDAAENMRDRKEQAKRDLDNAQDQTREFEDEIRKKANEKRNRSKLADLKDALRRAKPGQKQPWQRGGGSRAQRLRDYEQRARGGQGSRTAWKSGRLQRGRQGQGGQQGQGQQGQGQQGQGGQLGDGIGNQHDPNVLGDPTGRFGRTHDEKITGVHGKGTSRRETVLTAAKKGFASSGYRRAYADYRKIVEEVMSQEKVPQGYRWYVKRYFQRIKPQSSEESGTE